MYGPAHCRRRADQHASARCHAPHPIVELRVLLVRHQPVHLPERVLRLLRAAQHRLPRRHHLTQRRRHHAQLVQRRADLARAVGVGAGKDGGEVGGGEAGGRAEGARGGGVARDDGAHRLGGHHL